MSQQFGGDALEPYVETTIVHYDKERTNDNKGESSNIGSCDSKMATKERFY